MRFDQLCEMVLNEADYDTLSGKGKVFSLVDDAQEKVHGFELKDVKELIRRTTLPINLKYIKRLVLSDLSDYLPAETKDLKKMLKRNIWAEFDETEKKAGRAAEVLFAFLKKKKLIVPGIPKQDDPSKEDIETLAKELEADVGEGEYNAGLSRHDVGKLGGSLPRSTGHAEDESTWY